MEPDLERPLPTMAKPCPLTLGRDDGNRVRAESAYRLLPSLNKLGNSEHLNTTLNILRDEAAFKHLRNAQNKYDTVGPLKADKSDESFSLAMTLRDCTCFAQITRRAARGRNSLRPLKIKFGDFDMKSPQYRLEYWRGLEKDLIEGGFYTSTVISCDGKQYRTPTRCVLECSNDLRPEVPEIISVREAGHGNLSYVDKGAPKLEKGIKAYGIRTDAKTLRRCLETHIEEFQALAPRDEKQPNGRYSCVKYTQT